MTRLIVLYLVLLNSLSLGFARQAGAQTSAPPKEVIEQEFFPVVPSSMDRMWDDADVVAQVTIVKSETHGVIGEHSSIPRVETLHTAHVIKLFKGHKVSSVTFSQIAGQLEWNGKIIKVADAVPLASGDSYVVFMKRLASGRYALIGESDGAFKLRRGRVEPQGRGVVAEEHRNLPERRLLDEIERIASRRPKA